jgi:hypothetical protein
MGERVGGGERSETKNQDTHHSDHCSIEMAASLTDLTNLASRARRIGWWNGIVGVSILAC